jgi:glycosyltransferase involved in cell wall biosynthesis
VSTLTVILCNYNHGKYVGRAIDALMTQSRPPDELIVVDDGSSDDSVAVIEGCAARHGAIRFLRNERNLGYHASSARALAAATGDYVYNGAADDYVLPGFLQAVCELLDRHPQAGVGCAKVVSLTPAGVRIRSDGYRHVTTACYLSPAEYLKLCLEGESPMHSLSAATIYRREWLTRVGGWRTELGSWSDTFTIRAIALQTGLCFVPIDGVAWFVMPGGMSQATIGNPAKGLEIVRRAAALMRSPAFAAAFPADYVARWERAAVDTLVMQQLQSAIDGYQAVQETMRRTARNASWPVRCLLGLLRRSMTACYLASHHAQFLVLRRALLETERQQADSKKASE